ncbi:XRE family transcriptional regulator [Corallococcus sp. CA054B]|uniref:helix-turn-helix domain-containing protein n=1 Tax=Corallococcus sp. CA054B TaxID=2316734 RepID=UPI000EA0255F|nr:helix-turn-helix transcriptional regulator [Corallococcus sp. CA054B]RKG67882.1 XRE family transcriptional regulator [Corallococcus sp. CA054B]
MAWADRVKSAAFQLEVKKHRVTLDVAERLAEAMKARGMKASQLAEKLGKSRAWISKFLHGGRNTSFFTAVEIADALGLDIEVRLVERASLNLVSAVEIRNIAPSGEVIPFTARNGLKYDFTASIGKSQAA